MAGGYLAENIAHFGRALRAAGLPVGPASIVEAIQAVEIGGLAQRDDLYWALHAVLVTQREHRPVFDAVFQLFWQNPTQQRPMPDDDAPEIEEGAPKAGSARAAMALQTVLKAPAAEREVEFDMRATSSEAEVLRRRDFAQMTAAEIAEAKRRIASLRLPDDRVPTRRFAPSSRLRRFDARTTLRQSLRTGGKLILPRYREPRQALPPLVALLDISGSMSQYSRLLLHFLHAIGRQRRVTTFVFGTRLTNITRALRMKDPDEALAAASSLVADWSGGTRIAIAIETFNRLWSRRVLGQGAMVLLMTDGLERDGIDDLEPAMDRLHRSCRRLVWLNPLLRYRGFEPKARGIRVMLDHVDDFRTIHSLESMEALCEALSGPAVRIGPAGLSPAA